MGFWLTPRTSTQATPRATAYVRRAPAARMFRLLAALLIAAAFLPGRLCAAQLLTQMLHVAWRSRDGAPIGIRALAQTPDGLLWLGARNGIYSFDGKVFAPLSPAPGERLPESEVTAMLVAKNGALFAGFINGDVVRLFQGRLKLFHTAKPAEFARVVTLEQAPDGTIWCATKMKTLFLYGDEFHDDHISKPYIRSLVSDSDGNDWLETETGLLRRARGQKSFVAVAGNFGIFLAMAPLPGGGVLVSEFDTSAGRGRSERLDATGGVVAQIWGHDVLYRSLPEDNGDLWLATQVDGVRITRWNVTPEESTAYGPVPENRFKRADGLTSDATYALLRDRDGNMWVGTKNGLDRFRQAALTLLPGGTDGSRWFMCSANQNHVWVANTAAQMFDISAIGTKTYDKFGQNLAGLACNAQNDVWFEDLHGIWSMEDGAIHKVPGPPGNDLTRETQFAATADGTLLALSAQVGFWKFSNDAWAPLPRADLKGALPYRMFPDGSRTWLAYKDHLDVVTTSPDDNAATHQMASPPVGTIGALASTSYGVFASGDTGVAVSSGSVFKSVAFSDPTALVNVTGLAEDENQDLWLISSKGIVHVPADDIKNALADSHYRIGTNLVQENDFVGNSACICAVNTVSVGAGGKIWFVGLNGVASIDPRNLPSRPRPPLISIRSVLADDRPPNAHAQLLPNPYTVRIAYSGVNLTAPDSVVYRYKLDRVDQDWQDVGHRTEAIYTHLGPGTYTFHVMASNGDGVWTAPLAVAPFTVLPMFYQTWWFLVLCLATAALGLWQFQSWRMRTAISVAQTDASARAQERIAIAQDLHDTLLQGIQGLLLHFHVVAQALPRGERAHAIMEKALSKADEIIIEGRDRVSRLRSEPLTDEGLLASLETLGEDLNVTGQVRFAVERSGTIADFARFDTMRPGVLEDVYYIAKEAVSNAFRHAHASEITVNLAYERSGFTFRCRDNGIGLPRGARAAEIGRGHWGMLGMNERAGRIGASFKVTSAPNHGTELILHVAKRRLYQTLWQNLNQILSPGTRNHHHAPE